MEAPATRFQREVDPEDEGREVTLNENLATVKNLTICLWTACVAKTHHLFQPGGHEDDIWRAEEGDQGGDGKEHEVKLSNQSRPRGQTIKSNQLSNQSRSHEVKLSNQAVLEIF